MLDKYLFGEYIPNNSEVHKLNTTFKILSLIIMIIASFFIRGYADTIMIISYLILSFIYSGIPFKLYLKEIKYISILIVFILLVNIITLSSFESFICDIFRLFFIVSYFLIFIHTTTINDILNSHMKMFHIFNNNKISLYMSLIFKFPSYYIEELERINNIKKENIIITSFKEKILNIKNSLVLAFNNSIKKLNDIATIYITKLYGYSKARTGYKDKHFGITEYLLLILNIIILFIIIF